MNNKYRVLAFVSLVLFSAAFACFLIGFRSQAPVMIGSAFLIVSVTLFIGLMTNRALSKETAGLVLAPISRPITASHAAVKSVKSEPIKDSISQPVATDSQRLQAGATQPDPTDLIVSIVFGSITFLFLTTGIWIMFFGHRFLFG
ncbi:MAG: hypothetical protein AB8G95_26345 [Anaerolineae bacterium]